MYHEGHEVSRRKRVARSSQLFNHRGHRGHRGNYVLLPPSSEPSTPRTIWRPTELPTALAVLFIMASTSESPRRPPPPPEGKPRLGNQLPDEEDDCGAGDCSAFDFNRSY